MAVQLYMDVHVPYPITEQLRKRGVDVLTAIEDECAELTDVAVLERARQLNRVLFTHDVGFKTLAQDWQREGKPFAGLVFGSQLGGTIGQYVNDLELIARASTPEDWINVVEYIPYKLRRL